MAAQPYCELVIIAQQLYDLRQYEAASARYLAAACCAEPEWLVDAMLIKAEEAMQRHLQEQRKTTTTI